MKFAQALALGLGLLLASGSFAAEVTRYGIFVTGNVRAGEQVVTRESDGLVKVRFSYKNNGRLISPGAVYQSLGIRPFVTGEPVLVSAPSP